VHETSRPVLQSPVIETAALALVEANRKATEKAAEGLNDYNTAVAKAAEAARDKAAQTQQDVVWTGKQADVLREVTDQIRAQEQANRSNTAAAKDNNTQIQRQSELSREVSTIMRGMTVGMRLLTSGRLSLDGLVTHRFPLADIGLAFETAHAKPPGFVKATVTVDPS